MKPQTSMLPRAQRFHSKEPSVPVRRWCRLWAYRNLQTLWLLMSAKFSLLPATRCLTSRSPWPFPLPSYLAKSISPRPKRGKTIVL
jgi:hypothetical protein